MRADVTRLACCLALACMVALGCGPEDGDEPPTPAPGGAGEPQAPETAADPAGPGAAATSGLVVSFMLDPRLTTSVYMGERWVTPEIFTLVHEGEVVPVHARAHLADPNGRSDVSASWTSADHDMLAVSLQEAHQVELTVRHTGQTTLTVTHGESSRTLIVTASQNAGVWRVDISQ